jgi:hypothetical protein
VIVTFSGFSEEVDGGASEVVRAQDSGVLRLKNEARLSDRQIAAVLHRPEDSCVGVACGQPFPKPLGDPWTRESSRSYIPSGLLPSGLRRSWYAKTPILRL